MNEIFEIIMLLVGGLLAGALGGLLGIGGGIVLMPMLRFLAGLSPAYAAGTCILAVFFTTLGGSYRHYKLGHVNPRSLTPVMIAGAVATVIFSFVFLYLSTRERWLDLGVGLVFALISLRMIAEGIPGLLRTGKNQTNGRVVRSALTPKIAIGSLAGALPGLLGIGTGVILVPAFTYVLNFPIKVAMASSLTCFSVNAFISSVFKYCQGFIDLYVALPVCIGTLIGANLGARLNRSFPSSTLKLIFGIVFSSVSLKFILSFAR